MLLNLQKFMWDDGESLSVVQRTTFRTTRFYLRNIHSPHVWQRVLHGEINISGIGRALAGRALRRVAATADPALALLRQQETRVGYVRRSQTSLKRAHNPSISCLKTLQRLASPFRRQMGPHWTHSQMQGPFRSF